MRLTVALAPSWVRAVRLALNALLDAVSIAGLCAGGDARGQVKRLRNLVNDDEDMSNVDGDGRGNGRSAILSPGRLACLQILLRPPTGPDSNPCNGRVRHPEGFVHVGLIQNMAGVVTLCMSIINAQNHP